MNALALKTNVRTHGQRLFQDRVVVAFLLVAALFIAGEIIVSGFLSFSHVMTVLRASFFLGLVSLGQTIVVISGREGIDLSVGPMLTLGILLGAAIVNGNDLYLLPACLAVMAAGFILGLVNGIGISYMGIAPLIMTLAWGIVIQGILLFTTKGVIPGKASPFLELLGRGSIELTTGEHGLQIPWVVPIWIAIIAAAFFVLRRTSIGYILYGIGANDRAAELLGMKTKRIRMLVYGCSGMFSALTGVLLLGFVGHPNMSLAEKGNYVMLSVIAVLIGGVEFNGGRGSYLGAVAGAIFLTTLTSILVTLNIDEGTRKIVTGLVLIVLLVAYTRKAGRG